MTDTKKTDAKNETQTGGRKPDFKLVQEKTYYQVNGRGVSNRKSKTVDIAVGWKETSANNMDYISWSDGVMSITPDIDGRVKLVTFPIQD